MFEQALKNIDDAFREGAGCTNGGEAVEHRSPREIMDEIAALDAESAEALETIRRVL